MRAAGKWHHVSRGAQDTCEHLLLTVGRGELHRPHHACVCTLRACPLQGFGPSSKRAGRSSRSALIDGWRAWRTASICEGKAGRWDEAGGDGGSMIGTCFVRTVALVGWGYT